jgi:cobalt/nickel transport system permease protein
MYAGAGVSWYASLRKVRHALNTRLIPLISVFAPFSFIVMMFNLPLPGGTTSHAVGVSIASIVLGPAGAILATSIALTIQALFFGDGGITTLGANCFNIAVVGSMVSYGMYRLLSARAPIASKRRVFASAIAGYIAVNVAAFFTAIEFGLQPIFFHDAHGVPLYAPYSLRVAVPAMMIGHLMVAGLAEAAITAGMVAFLQHADPALLSATSLGAASSMPGDRMKAATLRRLWTTVALLMFLTPLGILAAGKAWGEWSVSGGAQTAAQTAVAPRQVTPSSLSGAVRRVATIWTAPMPNYAPPLVKSAAVGYLLSAMFGIGLMVAGSLLLQKLWRRRMAPGSAR